MPDMVSELEALERKAMHGEDMPKGLTQSQQLFYLSMTQLYVLYHNHTYTKEQAKSAKQEMIAACKNSAFTENLIQYHASLRNRYSPVLTEAEKHGCPICRKLVRMFDGRDRE